MTTSRSSATLTIPGRFNGPPGSGNGGYSCGVIAGFIAGDAEITLRSPPPLDRPLRLTQTADGVEVRDGETLVATGRSVDFDPPVVPSIPSWEEAVEASHHYLGHERHEFPTCFTCGTERDDGLAIYAGPIGGGAVAAPWVPSEDLPAADGVVDTAIVWAALDCPGGWVDARDLTEAPVVLGRMAARITTPVEVGRRHIALAWNLGDDGRKSYAATALIDRDGAVVASARQVWIAVSKSD